MNARRQVQFVREGEFVAEVDVDLTDNERAWGPYLSVDDAARLDEVRRALRKGDVQRAVKLGGRVVRLTPVAGS